MKVLAGASKQGDSSALMEQVQALASWKQASSVLLYAPLPEEPDTTLLINNQGERRLFFPRIEGDTLGIYRWGSQSRWIKGPFGLQEPDPASWEAGSPAEIDLVMVPGLAFDLLGRRLGRGRGYYDRLLGLPEFRGIKIGLAWSWQLLSSVPVDEHDARMDQVLIG